MKFRSIRTYGSEKTPMLVADKIYQGEIICNMVPTHGQPSHRKELKIVVYDETKRWNEHSPEFFVPAESE